MSSGSSNSSSSSIVVSLFDYNPLLYYLFLMIIKGRKIYRVIYILFIYSKQMQASCQALEIIASAVAELEPNLAQNFVADMIYLG